MNQHSFFHHPNISLTVIRRRALDNLMDLLDWYGPAILSGKPCLLYNSCFSSRTAYYSAKSRLMKAGFLAYCRKRDGGPVLSLTPSAAKRSEASDPRKFWNEKWRGYWSVLIYDIPEAQRRFRDNLRKLLSRFRMGCLQRSAWISPRDMRPLYNDLQETTRVQFVSYLFDAYTVLGRQGGELVREAWDFNNLTKLQSCYLELCSKSLERLTAGQIPTDALGALARDELAAYHAAMEHDPLLPRQLIPRNYLGRDVFEMHTAFVKLCKRAIAACR